MEGKSLWQAQEKETLDLPSLKQKIKTDVCIIGGGITGLTAALELVKAKKNVVLLEAYQIGGITTALSTGNLYVPVQPLFQQLEKNFGLETILKVAEFRKQAIDYIEENINHYQISCHFHRRPWFAMTNQPNLEVFEKEFAILKKLKLEAELSNLLPFDLPFKHAFVLPNQARLNPLRYVNGLSKAVTELGGLVFENSRALDLQKEKTNFIIKTQEGSIVAKKVFLATHSPIGIHLIQTCTSAYRSYVIGATATTSFQEGQVFDYDHNYSYSAHSYKTEKPDILLIAGNHHKTGQDKNTKQRYQQLEKHVIKQIPQLNLKMKWSAEHFHAADGLPYIGEGKSKNLYIATGFYADGLVYGTIAGRKIANLILNAKTDPVFDSKRHHPLVSIPFILKENINVMRQYVKDLPDLTKTELEAVRQGEGKVIEINQEKYAVSRDEKDELHIVSALCTHMKCLVNWNNAEQSWDCPCHGSRFKPNGEVIEGPAIENLACFNRIKNGAKT